MKELGEAINHSLSGSEQIAAVVSRIKAEGYDVFLVLEGTIGFRPRQQQPAGQPSLVSVHPRSADLEMSAFDVEFLKSLRISVGGEG